MKTIKGSIQITHAGVDQIEEKTAALLSGMLQDNQLTANDLASVLIGATDDLPGGFAEKAMEKASLSDVPLFGIQQFRYQSGMDRCIQIVMYPKQRLKDPKNRLLGCESWGMEI